MSGDYGSNEEPDVTTWYTRGAPRACDPQPEYYFIADDLVDRVPVDLSKIKASYDSVGRAALPNGKGLALYQARPSTAGLASVEPDSLAATSTARRPHPPSPARRGEASRPTPTWAGWSASSATMWTPAAPARADDWPSRFTGRCKLPSLPTTTSLCTWKGMGRPPARPASGARRMDALSAGRIPPSTGAPARSSPTNIAITLKADTPPGDYPVLVGMYRPDTGLRLDVLDGAGQPVANFIKLTTVTIR